MAVDVMLRGVRHAAVTSTRTRLGGAALGVGGVVYGLIQLLQQTIGAFTPRPVVSLLVALTIGVTGLVLSRQRQLVSSGRALDGWLRVWPLRRIGDSDRLELGVFPPANAAAGAKLGPYVPRDCDDDVRRALEAGGLVALIGDERAGKSRTASEVARKALGDRIVVVPVGGEALGALLGDASFTPPGDAVWWLDDLERFLPQIGGPELAALLDGRTVVTTIRRQAWETLLRAPGEPGERGRRLAAAAREVSVPAAASAGETTRAREIYPGLDASGVFGDALWPHTSSADEAAHPSPAVASEPDRVLVLGLGAMVAAAAALCLVVLTGGWGKNIPPPVSNQVDSIRRQAERDAMTTVFAGDETLHGVDEHSHIFVMRPQRAGSDELRIYDEDAGWLRRRISFRPVTRGDRNASDYPTEAAVRAGAKDFQLSPPDAIDIDGDGNPELVTAYEVSLFGAVVKLPIVVAWDNASQRYTTSPLVPSAPRVPGAGIRLNALYRGTYALDDPRSTIRLRANAVSEFRIAPGNGPGTARLLTATPATAKGRAVYAVSVYALTLREGRAAPVLLCGSADLGVRPVPARGRDASAVLRALVPSARTDTAIAGDGGCVVP